MKSNLSTVADRRNFLKAAYGGISGSLLADRVTARHQSDDVEPSVTFEDQDSNGEAVTISSVATDTESFVRVDDSGGKQLTDGQTVLDLAPGDVKEDVTIRLSERITGTQRLRAVLSESNAGTLAEDTATVRAPDERAESIDGMGPTLVQANPNVGFNYPYFLYAPDTYADEAPKPILVEPNNTGTATDDFGKHLEEAERTVSGGTGRRLADRLSAAFLIPVFPRPRTDPVNGDHYIHQLDDTTMAIEEGPLKRVDLQLLSMVEHARGRLSDHNYPVSDGIMMNGFSASGNFVNRFAILHPNSVRSVTAGGINGMATLPIAEAKGHPLDYHIGVANIEELTGKPLDLDSFRDVNQYLYMGELDVNDTIPHSDAWTDDDLRDIALTVYGEDMQEDRLPYSKQVYREVDASAVFRIYEDTGHTPRPAMDDLVEFHRRSLSGDDIEKLRADLGGNVPDPRANFVFKPQEPTVGDQVAFDASHSGIWNREIVEFEWDFGDGETATGEFTNHVYDTSGGHNVVLTVTDDKGESYRATAQIVVSRDDDEFRYKILGLSGGMVGVGSFVYVLKRRFSEVE